MNNETKAALPSHSTDVDMTSSWDNGANKKQVESPSTKSYFSKIFAYLDNGADDTVKSSYRYIHHEVSADGTPGAANMRALAAGMAALNGARLGTVIDEAGRKGVHAHLASHYEDAGRNAPPLLAKSELDSIYTTMETKSTELVIGQAVSADNVDEIVYGTIIESNDGEVAIREWTFTDEEWLPSEAVYDFPLEEVTADNFLFKSLDSIVQEYNLDDAPSSEEAQGVDNVTTIKSKDYEMTEQDFEVLVKSIAKLVIAEIGFKLDPSIEEVKDAAVEVETSEIAEEVIEEKTSNTEEQVTEIETEIKSEEVSEDAPAEEAEVEEAVVVEDAPAEEAAAECTNEEHTDECCGVAEEKAAFLTLNDLKEFSDLLDML